MSDSIEYSLEFNAPASSVYDAFLNSERHSTFTGAPAKIEAKVGGSLSTFNGAIVGKITSLKPNTSIELDWRPTAWPEGVMSHVKITLKSDKDKTKMEFIHTGVPKEAIDMIKKGWEINYWEKLPNHLAGK